ncbi:MAG: arylsulfatase [Opitutales bacterium]|nr:arylsulfatase [Opitutales bacterium]
MNKVFYPITLIVLVLTFGCAAKNEPAAAKGPPNIVLVIADDMGYSDLGCYGGEIETPALDKLAYNGVRFTNYYVHNMCWPTRASLLTSLYPKTALADGSASKGFRDDIIMLPQALKEAGYKSYMSGKWHLSEPGQPHGPSAPHKRGFDRTYSTYWGTTDFFAPADLNENGEDRTDEWKDNPDYYQTDAITDYSLKFLKEHDKDSPFFLYVAYNAAHWPLHARPEDIEHYKGHYAQGWDHFREARHAKMKELGVVDPSWELSPRNPEVPAWEDEEHKAWQERRMEVYAAQITCMDRNIGRIVQQLEESGELDNTIFIYQNDNGGCHVEYPPDRTGSWTKPFTTDGLNRPVRPGNLPHIMPGDQSTWQSYGYGWANVSNTPFRLFKQHDHEGGTRSPLIVSWPDGLNEKHTGNVTGEVVHVVDMMPTLLDLAGGNPDSRDGLLPFEGKSFGAVLTGNGSWEPTEELYWQHSKGKAARIGDWKVVSENRKPWELYQISDDGTELNNLAADMPEKVAELEAKHTAWDKRTNLSKK